MKGVKRLRNAESLTEEVEGKGTTDKFRVSSENVPTNIKNLNPNILTGAELEKQKTEARGIQVQRFPSNSR